MSPVRLGPGVHAADLMIYLRERLAEKRLAGFTRSTRILSIIVGKHVSFVSTDVSHSTKVASNHYMYVLTWLEV